MTAGSRGRPSRPASTTKVEAGQDGRRRLTDRLVIAASELLAHPFDDLEAAPDRERLGHMFADFRQPRSTAAGAGHRSLNDDALAFDVVRPWLACRRLAH